MLYPSASPAHASADVGSRSTDALNSSSAFRKSSGLRLFQKYRPRRYASYACGFTVRLRGATPTTTAQAVVVTDGGDLNSRLIPSATALAISLWRSSTSATTRSNVLSHTLVSVPA